MQGTQTESLDWLNALVAHLWPHIDPAATDLVKTVIEPEIQKNVPSLLKSIHFNRFSLGSVPPRVVSIRTVSRVEDSVTLHLDILYEGDPDISISFAGVHVGIKELVLKGCMTVTLRPLIPQIPVAGAVTVSFANTPTLDFNFSGAANVADLPFVGRVIRNVVSDVVSDLLVLPNMMTVKLAQDAPGVGDIFSRSYIEPWVVKLTMAEGSDLKNADAGLKCFLKPHDKSDPYAIVRLGAQTRTTPAIKDSKNPVWNECYDFLVHSDDQLVEITLYDEDCGNDDLLGTATVKVTDLFNEGEAWADVSYGGRVRVEGAFSTLKSDAALLADAGSPQAVLAALVDQAYGLPTEGLGQAAVRVTVAGQERTTKAVPLWIQVPVPTEEDDEEVTFVPKAVPNPEWEQALEFLMDDPGAHTVKLEVVADGSTVLGEASFPLSDVLEAEGLVLRQRVPLDNAAAEGSELLVSLKLYALTPATPEDVPARNFDSEVSTGFEWLSMLLKVLWPHIDGAAEKLLKETILPEVNAQIPMGVTVSCTKFGLESTPLSLDNFVVTTADNSVRLDLDVTFEGPVDIELAVSMATVGVSKIKFNGQLSILMKPLIDRIPVIGAVQVYFLNLPLVDFEFSGVAGVLDWPVVGKTVRQVVNTQLQQLLVLPNRMPVQLSTDTAARNMFWALYEPPLGVMRVTIQEAKGIKNVDAGLFSFVNLDSSDAFCMVALGDSTFTTTTCNNSLDPVWEDQTFEFVVCAQGQRLVVNMYDDDTSNTDDFLGRAQVTAGELIEGKDMWLPIVGGGGELHVLATWHPLSGDKELLSSIPEDSTDNTALVTVLVDKATGLPTEGFKAAVVKVTVGPDDEALQATKTTLSKPLNKTVVKADQEVVEPVPDPDWEAGLQFLVRSLEGLTVKCEVLADSELVGTCTYAVADLLDSGKATEKTLSFSRSFPLETEHMTYQGAALSVRIVLAGLAPE